MLTADLEFEKRLEEGERAASIYFDSCVEMMDSELRDEIHSNAHYLIQDLGSKSLAEFQQEFLRVYCAAHKARFDEEFIIN